MHRVRKAESKFRRGSDGVSLTNMYILRKANRFMSEIDASDQNAPSEEGQASMRQRDKGERGLGQHDEAIRAAIATRK